MDGAEENSKLLYSSLLRLLDDSQFLKHINSLSQELNPGKVTSFNETSTPRKGASRLASTDLDPFNDGLDSFLSKIPPGDGEETDDDNKEQLCSHPRTEAGQPAELAKALGSHSSNTSASSRQSVPGNQLAQVPVAIDNADAKEDLMLEENEQKENEQVRGSQEGGVEEGDLTFAAVGPLHEFGDFATYFDNKHKKQQMADEAFVQWEKKRLEAMGQSSQSSSIFSGCVIFVNGNTDPSWAVIHKLTILHGGKFISHLSNKGAATHIICDRLTPRKRIEFRNYKVVKAKWISDSVDQKQLLDWREYRLIDDVDYDQQRLGFSAIKQSPEKPDQKPESFEVAGLKPLEETAQKGGSRVLDDLSDDDEGFASDNSDNLRSGTKDDRYFEEDVDVDPELVNNELLDDDIVPEGQYAIAAPQTTEEPLPAAAPQLSQLNIVQQRTHTTSMDAKHPEFLQHFFANSRLHHLSTWKADLRAKFLRHVAKLVPGPKKQDDISRRVILHIDFDCFFVQASALSHPQYDIWNDPIAVSHGGKSSDVASCNYVAREHGIRNGMWLGTALKACPQLITIDYDFEAYEKNSNQFYQYLTQKQIFDSIFPVLIDEVLVDMSTYCSDKDNDEITQVCETIRQDIFEQTGCTLSIGIAENVLLAKLAIKKAKPNGTFYLHTDIETFLDETRIMDLPGLGFSISEKLVDLLGLDIHPKTLLAGQVKTISQMKLINCLGEKTGKKVFEYCRGIDFTKIYLDTSSSEALLGRKSVSVDVNFGIRFDTFPQAEAFLMRLARELHKRLIDLGVCGSTMTLKLAKRRPGTPVNPPKYLGLGIVDFFNKSSKLGVPTNDWGILGSEMKSLFRMLNIPVQELRGIAVSMSNLEDIEVVKKQKQQRLQFNSHIKRQQLQPPNSQLNEHADTVVNSDSIDWKVFNELPADIRRELKKELLRRGIPVSGKELSPIKGSPTKKGNGRVYFQQLFPSQPNGLFKTTKVLEVSPLKKRKLSPKHKATLPVKRPPSPTPINETISYDQDVLDEIPTLIREEFFKDLEWRKKNKRLNFVSMRQKLEEKNEGRKHFEMQELDADWLSSQPRLVCLEKLATTQLSYDELCQQSSVWVLLTLLHQGPHPDDVTIFCRFLVDLARQGNLNRSLNLLKTIKDAINTETSKLKLCCADKDERADLEKGIADWRRHYNETLRKSMFEFCVDRDVEARGL